MLLQTPPPRTRRQGTIVQRLLRLRLKCDGTRAEARFRLSAKLTSPFKSAGVSVQSTTGSRGVRISGSNSGYTMFGGSVKSTGYPLHWPVFYFTFSPVCHRVPSHFNWTLLLISGRNLPTFRTNVLHQCRRVRITFRDHKNCSKAPPRYP